MAVKDKSSKAPPVIRDSLLDNTIVAKKPAKPAQTIAAQQPTGNAEMSAYQKFRNKLIPDAAYMGFIPGVDQNTPTDDKGRQDTMKTLFGDNSSSITTPFSLKSYKDFDSKVDLSDDDIDMADTNDAKVADMKVLRIRGGEGKKDRYLTGRAMEDYLRGNNNGNYEGTTIGALQHRRFSESANRFTAADINFSGPTALNPDLVRRMNKDPQVASYVALAQREGAAAGIDGTMYANQLWQESRFNPNAVSPRGARGIAQMMPFQVGKYGLQSADDITDPETSIRAGARMMGQLTAKHGDQRLALVAYNGGEGAINFVEKNLGKDKVSFQEWHGFMSDRLEKLGSANRGAWHVETLNYTNKIALAAAPVAPHPA